MQISNTLKRAIDNSAKFARSLGRDKLETEHLLFGILLEKTEKSVRLLNEYGVNDDNYKKAILAKYKSLNITGGKYNIINNAKIETSGFAAQNAVTINETEEIYIKNSCRCLLGDP